MARPTAKQSKSSAESPKASTLLNFFTKAPGSATKSTSTSTSTTATTRRASNAYRTTPFVKNEQDDMPVRRNKGKEKAVAADILGSMNDPVVISDEDDEDDILPIDTPSPKSKRRKIESPLPMDDISSAIHAGPSRSPNDTPMKNALASPKASAISVQDVPLEVSTMPPPFAGCPEFRPPPTWPEIINTRQSHSSFEERDDEDEDGIPPSDEDGYRTQDPGEGTRMEDDDSDVEMEEEGPNEKAVPAHMDGGGDDFGGMDWEEPEDEGMGMEEEGEGDDEASEMGDVPKRGIGRGAPKGKMGRGAVGSGGKITQCPVCGQSMKGKVNTVVQHHINTCLDTSTPKLKSRSRANRPISSYNQFSPAPSPSPPPETPTEGPNAFSVLMSGHKEREQWKDAEADLKRDGKRFIGRRKAPFYKVLTGMPVAVDAFRYGAVPKVTAYLLTHAHSDHYTNLSKSWCHGPIYCSETTANLIIHMLEVDPKWVHGLPNDIPFEMPNTGGVTVTPIEANHCPGSSIFLFEGPQTVNAGDSGFASPYIGSKRVFRYLHCGDFRACPKMVLHPAIARAPIHTCYLDTTYLNPKYCFPPQPQVIEACASLARKTVVGLSETAPKLEDVKPQMYMKVEEGAEVKADPAEEEERSKAMMEGWLVKKEEGDIDGDVKEELKEVGDTGAVKKKGRTLVVMGTYSIGKERIVKAVAKALGTKIYCDPRKKGILLCQTDAELHSLMSDDPITSQVHLLPLGNIQLDRLQPYLARLHPHFDRVLAFRPTGWAYSPPAGTDMLPDVNMVIRRDQARWFSERDMKPMRGSCKGFMMYGVPYSEHSSFFELTCFALSMPGADLKMIATVNVGNEKSRAKMKKWFEKWSAEKARRKEKGLPAIVDYRDETYW
ncbi:hypothetical protein IAR55_005062 [Kwoniella newhampshirensis]|uniref:DNA cross-link repair 1A protein n=1 Tax=Kwoniella newhampshirensis TaxID=1651941 RepID=A0AAW0YX47_9TREE